MARTIKEIRQQRLMRVQDSKSHVQEIVDSSEYRAFRTLLKTRISDTHETDEVINIALGALKNVSPELVVTAIVELLADVIDKLVGQEQTSGEPAVPEVPEAVVTESATVTEPVITEPEGKE